MKTDVPTITVDMDRKCTECGKSGALESGICLGCAAKRIGKLGSVVGAPQFNEHNFELAKLAEEDPEVFSITGILVHREKTVVTNGRLLLEISVPAKVKPEQLSLFGPNFESVESFEPFIIPRKESLEIAKAISLRHDKEEIKRARIGQGDDAVAVINVSDAKCDRTFVVQKLSQTFPDYERMIANFGPEKARVTLNCDVLIPLLQVISKTTGTLLGAPVTIVVRGEDKAVSLSWTNDLTGQSLRAAIMPMKV